MQPIAPELLHKLSINGDGRIVAALAPELAAQLIPAGIDTPLRAAHFLAQCCYETGCFKRLDECLSYSAQRIGEVWPRLKDRAPELANNPHALGNAAYAGLNGNGDEAGGDGWLFKGRGLFQLTGRGNYREIGKLINKNIEADPDLVSQPHWAVATAIAFWAAHDINAAADDDNISRVTRLVNAGTLGLADRAILKHRALQLLQ